MLILFLNTFIYFQINETSALTLHDEGKKTCRVPLLFSILRTASAARSLSSRSQNCIFYISEALNRGHHPLNIYFIFFKQG